MGKQIRASRSRCRSGSETLVRRRRGPQSRSLPRILPVHRRGAQSSGRSTRRFNRTDVHARCRGNRAKAPCAGDDPGRHAERRSHNVPVGLGAGVTVRAGLPSELPCRRRDGRPRARDINQDGKREILISWGAYLCAVSGEGRVLWLTPLGDDYGVGYGDLDTSPRRRRRRWRRESRDSRVNRVQGSDCELGRQPRRARSHCRLSRSTRARTWRTWTETANRRS